MALNIYKVSYKTAISLLLKLVFCTSKGEDGVKQMNFRQPLRQLNQGFKFLKIENPIPSADRNRD